MTTGEWFYTLLMGVLIGVEGTILVLGIIGILSLTALWSKLFFATALFVIWLARRVMRFAERRVR